MTGILSKPANEQASHRASAAGHLPTVKWLRVEGAAVLVLSVLIYQQLGASWWLFAGLLLVPDVFMIGYLFGPRTGALIYNIGHTYTLPAGVAILGLTTGLPTLIPIAIIWFAHIGMDRMIGYGLKLPSGFKHTDLG